MCPKFFYFLSNFFLLINFITLTKFHLVCVTSLFLAESGRHNHGLEWLCLKNRPRLLGFQMKRKQGAYHSFLLLNVPSACSLSSPSPVQCLRQAAWPSAGVQDSFCPQSISLHSWLTLHSPVDDISSWVTSLLEENKTHWKHIFCAHHRQNTWLWVLPHSAVTVREPKLIEFEQAWKTQQTAIWMFAFEESSTGAGLMPC